MVFGGNPEPLRSIHKPLRQFIEEKLTDGEEPKVELIPRAITRFLEGLPEKLKCLDVSSCHLFYTVHSTKHFTASFADTK